MRCRLFVFLSGIVVAGACVHSAPAPTPSRSYWLSSDSSFYSPVVRFQVASEITRGRVSIAVDSGVIIVPGRFAPNAPVMMTGLYVIAFLGARNTSNLAKATSDTSLMGDRRGWHAVASSDSVLVAGQLRYGETATVRPFQLSMPLPATADSALWLVFRITGAPVDLRVPFEGPLKAGKEAGRVRVYACSDRNLAGQLDTARSSSLRRTYGLVC